MSDVYEHWRYRLKTGAVEGAPVLPTLYGGTPECPQPGMYKTRQGKGGPMVPVQIWLIDGEGKPCHTWTDGLTITGTINGEVATDAKIADRWIWLTPVTKEEWNHFKANKVWPGEVAIGHNSGDLSLTDEIDEAYTEAVMWLTRSGIKDKITADMAANYRQKLLDLSKKADKERESKVRPHLDAQREINAEYKPLVDRATEAANKLRDALTVWMRAEEAKARAAAEEARKAEAARVEAERARLQAERDAAEAARLERMKVDPIAVLTEPEVEPLPTVEELIVPAVIETPKVSAGGQRGKKAGLRTQTFYDITDYAAVLAFVSEHEEVRAAVQKVAATMAKAGVTVPGLVKREERVAA